MTYIIDRENYLRGKEAAIAGDIILAREILLPITKFKGDHPAAYFLALAEFNFGDFEKAKIYSKSFIENNPNHAGIYLLLGRLYLREEKFLEAKSLLEKATKHVDTSNTRIQQLEREIKMIENEKCAISSIEIIDQFFREHKDSDPNTDVIRAAEALAELKPIGNWSKDVVQAKIAFFHFAESVDHALKNYIPDLLEITVEFDYLSWPKRIHNYISHKKVIDVGCGFGGYGTGFLTAGAKSYLGLDPEMNLSSTRAKNKRTRKWSDMGITPDEISRRCPDIRLFLGTSEELTFNEKFDVISLHNVTEHLMQLDLVFKGLVKLCHAETKIIFMHHNYYCWNGHHLSPNQPHQIKGENGEGEQTKVMDWRHISLIDEVSDDHYIKTHLNRVTLDEMKEITERYFDIEEWNEIPSNNQTLERLTPEILSSVQKSRPYLTRRDLEINVVFALSGVKK